MLKDFKLKQGKLRRKIQSTYPTPQKEIDENEKQNKKQKSERIIVAFASWGNICAKQINNEI